MKNNLIMTVIIFGAIFISNGNVRAQNFDLKVDNTFSYQGELIDAGSPANGEYDFKIRAESTSQGPIGPESEHTQVNVTNGLFFLENVDLGSSVFDDATELFLRVSVRKTADAGAYTDLSPSQLLTSVPFASQLISGGADDGQVLTFNGVAWSPQDLPPPPAVTTPWDVNGTTINYDTGKVGIGIGNEAHVYQLQVKTTTQFPASFDGGNNSTVAFKENGATRGLIGSGNNIGADDFSIATPVSSTGKIHIAPKVNPVLTVTPAEFVGIGEISPTSALHVKTTDSNLVAQFDGGDGAVVSFLENGSARGFLGSLGVGIGANDFVVASSHADLHLMAGKFNTPSISIKAADSETTIKGNIKQPETRNGVVKYMASINNCGDAGGGISHSYNGIDGDAIMFEDALQGNGSCRLVFTNNIDARYVQATVMGGLADDGGRGVTCKKDGNFLSCTVYNTITGSETPGSFDVIVY